MMRSGSARTLVRWAKMLPDEQLVEHPELAMAAATAVSLVGPRTVERRRFLQLAERARTAGSARFTPYVDAGIGMVRALDLRRRSQCERRGRPPCGRDRRARGRRCAGRCARQPSHRRTTSTETSRPPRRRPSGRSRTPRPSDGRPPTRSPGRRSPWPTSIGGFCRAARDPRGQGEAMIGAIHSSRSWLGAVAYADQRLASMLPKGSSSRRSESWSTRSGSSATSCRPFTTPGCCCFWPASAVAAVT